MVATRTVALFSWVVVRRTKSSQRARESERGNTNTATRRVHILLEHHRKIKRKTTSGAGKTQKFLEKFAKKGELVRQKRERDRGRESRGNPLREKKLL